MIKTIAGTLGPIVIGVACLSFLTPSEDDILKELPDNERKRFEERQREREEKARAGNQTDLLALLLKQNVESNRPFWDVRPVKLPDRQPAAEVEEMEDTRVENVERQMKQASRFYR